MHYGSVLLTWELVNTPVTITVSRSLVFRPNPYEFYWVSSFSIWKWSLMQDGGQCMHYTSIISGRYWITWYFLPCLMSLCGFSNSGLVEEAQSHRLYVITTYGIKIWKDNWVKLVSFKSYFDDSIYVLYIIVINCVSSLLFSQFVHLFLVGIQIFHLHCSFFLYIYIYSGSVKTENSLRLVHYNWWNWL